jgi:hypothetical protein
VSFDASVSLKHDMGRIIGLLSCCEPLSNQDWQRYSELKSAFSDVAKFKYRTGNLTSLEKDRVDGMLDPVVGNVSTVRIGCGIDVGLKLRNEEHEGKHQYMMYELDEWFDRAGITNGQCFVLIMLTVMKIRYIMRAKKAIRNNGVKCEDQDLAKQILGLEISFPHKSKQTDSKVN